VDNLLVAWREFLRGKRKRKDVENFSLNLVDNILNLHTDLVNKTYRHGSYSAFKINDPKARDIHKASVRDRLLHHAIYRILYPHLDSKFIFDSFSCRKEKGTHKAINRFKFFIRKLSKNNSRTAWVLKCDIRKFFANINHKILLGILGLEITDTDTVRLLEQIITSFNTRGNKGVGLPLGNLTSQLLVNVYMNVFDHFVKRELKIKYYIRYADDFVILSENKEYLEDILPQISRFLETKLKLSLHPNKVFIKTIASGVDFLGWMHFPHHRIPRTSTKRRMFRNLGENPKKESIASYEGLLSHGNTYKLKRKLENYKK
jgi:retron-type reverse transcriptase